jgi:transposase
LQVLRDLLLAVQDKLDAATRRIENAATSQPYGVGALTSQVLEREIMDWNRFANRRQVGSLTGMCPGVHSSGGRSRSGPITKHGNRRIRTALVELSWRCVRFQPQYPPIKKWWAVLQNPKATGAMKKKAIVAVGRKLAIDLWRINTGRASAQKLGLK